MLFIELAASKYGFASSIPAMSRAGILTRMLILGLLGCLTGPLTVALLPLVASLFPPTGGMDGTLTSAAYGSMEGVGEPMLNVRSFGNGVRRSDVSCSSSLIITASICCIFSLFSFSFFCIVVSPSVRSSSLLPFLIFIGKAYSEPLSAL